jgi:hypothetical protein
LNLVCKDGPKVDNTWCGYTSEVAEDYSFGSIDEQTSNTLMQPRRITGVPEQLNLIRTSRTVQVGPRWTIEGLRFDGARPPAPTEGRGTFVHVVGSHVTLRNNWIGHANRACVGLGGDVRAGLEGYNRPDNVVIRNNTITDCRDDPPTTGRDVHCVHNRHSRNVQVLYNSISECQADGYQTENNKIPGGADPALPSVASDTVVRGNRIWATEYRPSSTQCWTVGEGGIDIKRTGIGLKLQDNLIFGYQPSAGTTCPGTGTNDHGTGIVLHGAIEDNSSGNETEFNPLCSQTLRDLGGCAVVEGNDISGSAVGIGVGSNPGGLGKAPSGVVVRGNIIHDLQSQPRTFDGDPLRYAPQERGEGMRLAQHWEFLNGGQRNLIYRNTLVNVPGRAMELKGYTTTADETDSRNFTLANNLVAHTASRTDAAGAVYCRGPFSDTNVNGVVQYSTYFNNALNNQTPVPASGADFVKLMNRNLSSAETARTCGALDRALPGDFFAKLTSGDPYGDYRIVSSSAAVNTASAGAQYEKIHSEVTVSCGGADHGATEACTTDVIYMQDDRGDGAAEESLKDEGGVWFSDDITVMNANAASPLELGAGTVDVPFNSQSSYYDEPSWDKQSEIWVRIRSNGSLASGEDLQVRVYQARPHTSSEFPRDFEVVVPAASGAPGAAFSLPPVTVKWAQGGTGYRLVGTNGTHISVYAFPWRPSSPLRAVSSDPQHSCIRAEISTARDPRAPFFTHVRRTNNIVQRNININAQGVRMGSFPIVISPRATTLAAANAQPQTRMVRVFFSSRDLRRKAYFYVPPQPGAFFDANSGQAIPSSAIPLVLFDDITPQIQIPADRPLQAQVIIDSTQAGPPHPADHFWVDDGLGRVKTHLVSSAYSAHANSAEFGLPPGWTATGAWRVLGGPGNACADARTGRSAFAFNLSTTCTFEGATAGALTLPSAPLPCGRSKTTLSFWHWSQTERNASYDKREVRISVNGGAWQTVWSAGAQDFGGRGQWQQQVIDLSAHRGRNVQVQFFFDPVDNTFNNYAGWYVDDIEVK